MKQKFEINLELKQTGPRSLNMIGKKNKYYGKHSTDKYAMETKEHSADFLAYKDKMEKLEELN